MTISSTTSRNDYTGNNSTATFSYTFKINAKTDLKVTQKDTSGVETTLVVDTDFTVSGVGADAGGTITLNAGNLATDYTLTIRRNPPLTQETSIRNQSEFFPSIHEDEFDGLVMIAQAQQEQIDRALKVPETEVGGPANTTLPSATARASAFLAFDASGNPIASTGGISPSIPVSTYIQTLLDDADAPTARTTLGVIDNPIKAFVNFDGSGSAPTVRKGFNVASIAKIGTGVYRVTLSTPMANSNYAVMVTAASYSGVFIFGMQEALATFAPTTTQFQIRLSGDAGAVADSNSISVLVIGDQ